MTNTVNPPPHLRIPKQFLNDAETREFFKQQNVMLFQLWVKTGGNLDPISDIDDGGATRFSPISQQIIKRLNGLPEFTIDTSGFTTDLTFITTDKVIA